MPSPYSLRADSLNSEGYYDTVRVFTDEVLAQAARTVVPVVHEFADFVKTYGLEELRRTEEYVLELLSFGVLWNCYGTYSRAVRLAPFITMARMAEWRKKHRRAKPAIDIARGILTTLFLLPKRADRLPYLLPRLQDVDDLSRWLEATGEFREQALRFIRWRAFWEVVPFERRIVMRRAIFDLTHWFTLRSDEVLGTYSQHVEGFLQNTRARYRWREDRVSCSRSRVEYHLNMVGPEMMNRAFRQDYLATDTTAVLVPGCMRARPDGECEAVRVKEGLRCTGCRPECGVNRLRERGKRQRFEVYVIPHASDLSLWAPRPGEPRRGVVASACVTTLVEGGWELKRYGVPAQCVLLDASGCKKHWDLAGRPTSFNVRELSRILET